MTWFESGTPPEPPERIGLHRVSLAMVRPHRSAHHTVRERESILVRWERRDGHVGWGECPTLTRPGYATETTDRAWSVLVERILPEALDSGVVPDIPATPAACGAVRDACLDARLRSEGTGLTTLVDSRMRLSGTGVVAAVGDDAASVAAAAERLAADGVAAVKVKVTPDSAPAVVEAVLAAVAPLPVALDANGTFVPGVHDDVLHQVLAAPLAYLEQPFAPSVPPTVWAAAARRGDVPIAIDESATSAAAVGDLVLAGGCRVVSVKPARLGGLAAAAATAAEAVRLGASCFVGGMFELGVGRSAALRLAGAPWFDLPTDLGPSRRYLEVDLTDPILDEQGRLVVPTGPGCSLHPLPDRLVAAEAQRFEVVRG